MEARVHDSLRSSLDLLWSITWTSQQTLSMVQLAGSFFELLH